MRVQQAIAEAKLSHPASLTPKATGQGLPLGASQGSLLELGEGGAWPRRIQKGSLEHHLLTEAKVIAGGSHMPGRTEAGMRRDKLRMKMNLCRKRREEEQQQNSGTFCLMGHVSERGYESSVKS